MKCYRLGKMWEHIMSLHITAGATGLLKSSSFGLKFSTCQVILTSGSTLLIPLSVSFFNCEGNSSVQLTGQFCTPKFSPVRCCFQNKWGNMNTLIFNLILMILTKSEKCTSSLSRRCCALRLEPTLEHKIQSPSRWSPAFSFKLLLNLSLCLLPVVEPMWLHIIALWLLFIFHLKCKIMAIMWSGSWKDRVSIF